MFESADQWSQSDYFLTGGFAVIVLIMLISAFFYYLNRIRVLRGTPRSKVRSAAQGYVELSGTAKKVKSGEITAPYGDIKCLWYHFTIEQYKSDGDHDHWEVVHEEKSTDPFWLEDETGQCLVLPHSATVITNEVSNWKVTLDEKMIREFNIGPSFNFLGTERFKLKVNYLPVEKKLFCLGAFNTLSSKDALDQHPHHRSMSDHIEEYPTHVLSNHDVGKRPFMLSDCEEKSVVRSAEWMVLGSAVGSILAIAVAIFMFWKGFYF